MNKYARVFAVTMAVVCWCSAFGADWGNLKVRFELDGSAPAPKPLNINKDTEFCGKFGLVDEQLVVNPENKGIANVVVYLYVGRGDKKPPVADSYKAAEKATVRIDNEKCRFEPHILGVRVGQTVIAGNKDTVGHNTNVTTLKNPPQNILIPASGELKLSFAQEELLPSPVACNIHPWMKGYLVIKDHPYVGISDKDGNLVIKDLPAGKWTFQFWHEVKGYLDKVTKDGKATSWSRGRVELEVKPGENDLGVIKVSASEFKVN